VPEKLMKKGSKYAEKHFFFNHGAASFQRYFTIFGVKYSHVLKKEKKIDLNPFETIYHSRKKSSEHIEDLTLLKNEYFEHSNFFGRNLFEMGESAQLRFALKNFG
jgi:hypothetical protein